MSSIHKLKLNFRIHKRSILLYREKDMAWTRINGVSVVFDRTYTHDFHDVHMMLAHAGHLDILKEGTKKTFLGNEECKKALGNNGTYFAELLFGDSEALRKEIHGRKDRLIAYGRVPISKIEHSDANSFEESSQHFVNSASVVLYHLKRELMEPKLIRDGLMDEEAFASFIGQVGEELPKIWRSRGENVEADAKEPKPEEEKTHKVSNVLWGVW